MSLDALPAEGPRCKIVLDVRPNERGVYCTADAQKFAKNNSSVSKVNSDGYFLGK